MPQQKSTSFSAAKVANFGVVMAEMVSEMSVLRKEVKRLRHHVSVLSKRNDRLVKDGKSRAVPPIASGANRGIEDSECGGEEVADVKAEVAAKEATVEAGAEAEEEVVEVAEAEAEVAEEEAIVEAEAEAEGVAREGVSGGSADSSDDSMGGDSDEVVVEDGRLRIVAPRGPREWVRGGGGGRGSPSGGPVFNFGQGVRRGRGYQEHPGRFDPIDRNGRYGGNPAGGGYGSYGRGVRR